MPEEENKTVPIDTSGPDEEVVIEEKQETVSEEKPEIVVEETTEQETESKETLQEGGEAKKEETKKDDDAMPRHFHQKAKKSVIREENFAKETQISEQKQTGPRKPERPQESAYWGPTGRVP